jgi:6-phosphofructokinase 1
VVVVSEGLRRADGKFLAESEGSVDAFGHSQLGGVGPLIAATVKDKLDMKVHWTVPDYLQRSARHLASKTDLAHALAVGKAGVEYALKGLNGTMPVIQRLSDKPYRWKIVPAQLADIANHEKKMPANFISADGYGITPACRRYLQPLIRGEAPPPYASDGLPKYVDLPTKLVPRRLPAMP